MRNPLKAREGRLQQASLRSITAVLLLSLLIASPALTSCGNDADQRVIVAGSTSVQPYAEVLAEHYFEQSAGVEVDVQGGGSSAGITAAQTGTADIGMSSRSLKESEAGLYTIEIAKDGLAIIVHPNNPVSDLTLNQLRKIYATEITHWNEVGGTDTKIHIITREDGSGTRSAFEELVMGDMKISPRAIVQDSNGAVRQLVADDPNAIGFISLGLVEIGERPVKAISLGGIAANHENVLNGTYNLSRPFLFVCNGEPTGSTKDFIDFVLSEQGRDILRAEGLIVE
jgi:phosphate transport system substrate-binding protein